MAKSELGTKRICPTTGKKFYDLNKSPVISPYTGEVVPIVVAPVRVPRGEAARAAAATAAASDAAPEPAEAEGLVSLEEADAEENTGKVKKAVVPESEDDIEIDDTLDDDEDDDSTFIADEEEGDEDVTDIIGDVGDDEET
ncbi:TIGR02300 family protein [Nitrobacter sp. JJSN]|uniref:TIGR02300 family protein n=1 Tax=Nitrobacter sp. JJSN TaxID=3453033 RepID=UPI003F75F5DF